jgi:hypothetical protein
MSEVQNESVEKQISKLEKKREELMKQSDSKGKRTGQGSNFKKVFEITQKIVTLKSPTHTPIPGLDNDNNVRPTSKSVS